jgi:hypothetical protein
VRTASRASRLAVQIALLVALLASASYMVLRNYLDNDEELYQNGRVNEVVSKGPVRVANLEWQLDSIQAYTALVDKDGEKVSLSQPAGSVVVVAMLTVTPHEGEYLKDGGFTCSAVLRDDRGNTWQGQGAYDYKLPTSCSDDDHPFTVNKPGQIAQVYVVPETAVPHLSGVIVEDLDGYRRVMITR